VTIWYDVSDLTTWHLPHLTGIQRSTVGILNGLIGQGVVPRLTRFDTKALVFEAIGPADLPANVRSHLLPLPAGSAADRQGDAALQSAGEQPPVPPTSRERIFGASPAADDLRLAFRDFKAAAKHLRRSARRWLRARFRSAAADGPPPLPGASAGRRGSVTAPVPQPVPPAAGPFAPGDVLLSLGASWPIEGHAEAAAAARRRGVVVLRMVYDLIPTIKPQWVDEVTCRQVTQWVRNVLTESSHVLTISEFSRREIEAYCAESHFPVPPLTVVRLGDELDATHDAEPPLPRFVPRRPFFVCVSTLDVRKNHRLLYDAWTVLATRDPEHCPDLVCLGVPHLYVHDLMREIRQDRLVNGRIHFLQGIEDVELAWYYRHSAATIYPSRYEGWGLPVAESLGHGRLCLASGATSIPEISPELPAFFDPLDVHALVALVERTLRDPEWVRAREAEIRARFVSTPWTHTAAQVRTGIEAATAAGRRREAA